MAKILIVDDDNDFRSMLAELFNRAAYTVIESRDGQEGLKMAALELPDVVITDIIMPNQDGIGLIMSLARQFPTIKIIAISGGGSIHSQFYLEMAKTLGANQIFIKPLNNKKMLETVHALSNCQK